MLKKSRICSYLCKMIHNLHENQRKMLETLRANIDNPLTMIELMGKLNLSSTSVVHHHIQQLEKKGYLKRNPSNPKDYYILGDPEKPIIYINQYGNAECGPSGSVLDGKPVDRIPIASRLLKFPSEQAFMVVAKGNSMEPQISSGDLIIAQKMCKTVESGEIVVCMNDGELLVKKLFMQDNIAVLHSINTEYSPFLANESFTIEGVVRNVIKYFG